MKYFTNSQVRSFVLLSLIFSVELWAYNVPLKVKEELLYELVVLSGTVVPKESETIYVGWNSLIKKVNVFLGQEVKKDQLIAEVEMKFLANLGDYYLQRETHLNRVLQQAQIEENYMLVQQKNARQLASKNIVSESDAEKQELNVLVARIARTRAEAELRALLKDKKRNEEQMRRTNFYAPIDGVVTDMLINPKQLSGAFMAPPRAKLARVDKAGVYRVLTRATDQQIASLRVGHLAKVILEGTQEALPCQIVEISPSTAMEKEGVSVFDVVGEFKKSGPILYRGGLARLEIPQGKIRKGVLLPWNAVKFINSKPTVIVYDNEKGWYHQTVALGSRLPKGVEIKTGLKVGDFVQAELW